MKKNLNCSSPNYLKISYLLNYKSKNLCKNINNINNSNQIDKSLFKYNLSKSKKNSTKTAKVSPENIHIKIIKKLKNKPNSNPNSKSKSKSKEKGNKNLGKNNLGKSGKFKKAGNKIKNINDINNIFFQGQINKKITNQMNNINQNKLSHKKYLNLKQTKKQDLLHKITKAKTNIFGFCYNNNINHIINRMNRNNFKTTTPSGLNSNKSSKEKKDKKIINITYNSYSNSINKKNKRKNSKKHIRYNKNIKIINNLLISKPIKSNLKRDKYNFINKIKNIIVTNETNNKYKHNNNLNINNKSLLINKNPLVHHLNKKLSKTKTDIKSNFNKLIKKNYDGFHYNNIANNINLYFVKKLSRANTKFINHFNIYTKTKNKNKNINNSSIFNYCKFMNNFTYSSNSKNSKHNSKSNSYKKTKFKSNKYITNEKLKNKVMTGNNTKIENKLFKKYTKNKNISKKKQKTKVAKRKNFKNNNTTNKSALLSKKEKLIKDFQNELIINNKLNIDNNKKYIENYINNNKDSSIKNNKNHINDLSISLLNENNNYYYLEESKKLSEKIKAYGQAHEYKSYPKTNLHFYKIGRILGRGAFGKVNLALHILSGYLVAMKSFNKNKKNFPMRKIKNEVKIMQKHRYHKGIIKLLEAFENEKYYFIIMENIIGGNLFNAINKMGKLPESLARNIFKQLIETVQYIHSKGIVHRDIKPDNILLNLNNQIKLCDFGVSKEIKKGILISDSCGTPAFIAPEILLDAPYDPYMTDIWSCGVVLYVMVSGFFPFAGINENELHQNILNGQFLMIDDISKELKDLINKILELNPNKRISINEILNHPWLNIEEDNNNQKNLLYKDDLFTNAEKIIYYKLRKNYKEIKNNDDFDLENFTYRNIETDYQDENLNDQSTSIIITPFNSKRKDFDDDLFYNDINIENYLMKFLPKVNELNKLYELNNNCDFDQGIMLNRNYNSNNKLMNSFNESYIKKQNEIKIKNKEEKMIKIENKENKIDKNNEIENENRVNNENINLKSDEIIFDDNIISYVENLGYKREYIIKSLELNDLNYATATYYLKFCINDK